jgi:uncharacterized membrane protein SirB2
MDHYIALKHTHTLIAFLSILGFGLKGYVALIMRRPLSNPLLRIAPHINNAILIVLGLYMWHLSQLPLMSWFGVKLLLVVTYFAMDGLAFSQAKKGNTSHGIVFYLIGLGTVLTAAWLAVAKPPLL